MGSEPARAREERSADNGRGRVEPGLPGGARPARPEGGRKAREGTEYAGWRSHRDRCFRICFLMIPAMLQPRPPRRWERGVLSAGRGAGPGCRSHGGRHGALRSPLPQRPGFPPRAHPPARRRSLRRRRTVTARRSAGSPWRRERTARGGDARGGTGARGGGAGPPRLAWSRGRGPRRGQDLRAQRRGSRVREWHAPLLQTLPEPERHGE